MKQRIEIFIENSENVGVISKEDIARFQEVFNALIRTGGLTGVRGGQTIIHFDSDGNFMGVNLNYWPYRRRKT